MIGNLKNNMHALYNGPFVSGNALYMDNAILQEPSIADKVEELIKRVLKTPEEARIQLLNIIKTLLPKNLQFVLVNNRQSPVIARIKELHTLMKNSAEMSRLQAEIYKKQKQSLDIQIENVLQEKRSLEKEKFLNKNMTEFHSKWQKLAKTIESATQYKYMTKEQLMIWADKHLSGSKELLPEPQLKQNFLTSKLKQTEFVFIKHCINDMNEFAKDKIYPENSNLKTLQNCCISESKTENKLNGIENKTLDLARQQRQAEQFIKNYVELLANIKEVENLMKLNSEFRKYIIMQASEKLYEKVR